MKNIFLLVIVIFFSMIISSCWKEDNLNNKEIEKKDFFLDVKKISEFDNIAILKKNWILDTSENITLSSNVSWRIKSILVKPWDKIYENQLIAVIEDNIANYNLNLKSASNNLESSKNAVEVSKNALESSKNAVKNSKNALESSKNALEVSKNALNTSKNSLQTALNNKVKSEINYDLNKLKLEKSILDLKRNLNNLDVDNLDSSSYIEIQKIDNSINKINIEYENLLLSNRETIAWFWRNLEKDFVVLKNYMDDVIYFWDEILWITNLNKDKNNSYEIYLWAKNSSQKIQSEDLLRKMINYRNNDLKYMKIDSDNEVSYRNTIDILNLSYSQINDFLNSLDTTLSNTVESVWAISQLEISWYKTNISLFRNIHNSNKSQLISLWNSISSFLETYKNSQASLLKQIENLEKDKNIYKSSLNLSIENNKATLNESISNMELTLRSLEVSMKDADSAIVDAENKVENSKSAVVDAEIKIENSKSAIVDAEIKVKDAESRVRDSELRVKDAEIAYSKALDQLNKLSIKSPINWTISDILIDRWQEVSPSSPLFSILNESSNEVKISFTKEELDYINEDVKAYYYDWIKTHTWNIYSISRNADANFKYQARIVFPWQVTYIWNILSLEIPITIYNKLVPINSIKINNSWIWTLNYYSKEGTIKQVEVKTWEIYGDKVEIIWDLEDDLNIILNYVDNFDKEKFILKTK